MSVTEKCESSMSSSRPNDSIEDWVDVKAIPLRPKSPVSILEPAPFYQRISQICLDRLDKNHSPIFTADIGSDSFFDCFLQALPLAHRQQYNCDTCRRFLDRFASLALVTDEGHLTPLLWDPTDATISQDFRPAVSALAAKFEGKQVTKEFKVTGKHQALGVDELGGFNHFHVTFPDARLRKEEPIGFASAPTSQLAEMLVKVLSEYKIGAVRRAAQILNQNKLPYADNHKAAINWLLDLVENDRIFGPSKDDFTARHNLTCRYAASAFVGCLNQLRNGALSTLLDDVKSNRSWKSIELQWLKIANPLHYMRPQEAPKAGNIAASERLFKELGLTAEDMRRRYLTAADIPQKVVIWQQKLQREISAKEGSIFGNVEPRMTSPKTTNDDLPPTSITFTKLINDILPKAKTLEYKLGHSDSLAICITGLDGSKPLMQWHDDTNLASWYVWNPANPVSEHGLRPEKWNKVTRIIPMPHLWDAAPSTTVFPIDNADSECFKHYHKKEGFRYLLSLDGAHDIQSAGTLGLFPEFLKNEFHGVRSTIEKYSNSGKCALVEDAHGKGGYVCGVVLSRSDTNMQHLVRVTDFKGQVENYKIVLFE